ncbi:MAG: hypothetical protein ABR585_10430 [Gemmatimonadaceae bacterium]
MTMKVVVASDPDREDLFAEIQQDDQPWAELTLDSATKKFVLTIYPPGDGGAHVFPLSEAEQAIADAKDALTRRGYQQQ